MEEQCRAYAKQAGIKDSELDYSVIGSATPVQAGGNAERGALGYYPHRRWLSTLYPRSQGHLLEVTDLVEKINACQAGCSDLL